MAWIRRDVQIAGSVLFSTLVVANCSSTPPPAADCVYKRAADGSTICVQEGQTATGATSGSGGASAPSNCVPGINCPSDGGKVGAGGTPTSNGGSVVGQGGTPPGVNGGTPPVGNAGTPSTNGGSAAPGGSSPVAGSGGGSTAEGGGAPVATGGTAGTPPVGGALGRIQVSAGEKARDHSVASFSLPAAVGKNVVLKDAQGNQVPLQVDADGNAIFVVASLAAGAQAEYTIEELPAAPAPGITTTVEGEQLFVKQGDKTVFRWVLKDDNFRNRAPNDVRSGYVYPLYTPGGVSVADDYAEDHPHMHGIWSAWTLTTFRNHKVDFWNGYDNSGHVDLKEMKLAWSGPVHAGFKAAMIHEDITTNPRVTALNEEWTVTVYKTHDAAPPYYIFDIASTQEAATSDPLILETYHYGGFGFRGAAEWQGANGASYLTSEGFNRGTGDGSRARWCAQWGTVNGKVGGYAGLDHPTNFRHPQGLRIHPSNPYWSFTASTEAAGGRFTIEPGKPYRSRYRVVVFDGAADAALINRIWDDFGSPPTVTVLP